MTRTIRQTVTLEVELVAHGDADPEVNEIIINGKGYGPADLAAALAKGSYAKVDAYKLFQAVETLANWAAVKDEWEVTE